MTIKAKAKGNDMTPKAKAMTSKAKVKINTQVFRPKDNDDMSQVGVVLLLSGCSGIFLPIVFSSCLFCKLYIILFNRLERQSSQSHTWTLEQGEQREQLLPQLLAWGAGGSGHSSCSPKSWCLLQCDESNRLRRRSAQGTN